MAKKNRNSWVGVLIGLAIAFFAIVALWKNETRFNFYAAANNTPTVPVSYTHLTLPTTPYV